MAITKTLTLFHCMCLLGVFGWKLSSTDQWEVKAPLRTSNHHDDAHAHTRNYFHDEHKDRIKLVGTGREKYRVSDKMDNRDCHETNVSFYRHFDEAIFNITGGVTIDNAGKGCACTTGNFILCNCSSANFYTVPQLSGLNMNGLDLYNNRIQFLDSDTFKNYFRLKYLSLQTNSIDRLSLNCFRGLTQLRALDLRNNYLSMIDGTYPIGVFKDLPNLVALRINNNSKDVESPHSFYPHRALADLKSLEILSMDGLRNKTFREGFGLLTNLETLSLSGYHDGRCKMVALTIETLRYLTNLKLLNVSDCFLESTSINTKALQHLTNIHTIDFTWNEDMSIDKVAEMLGELTHSGMKELFARRIEWRFSPGTTIKDTYAKNLPRNLTCLVASGNSVNYLQYNVFEELPETLRYIDFSGNKLVFGRYLSNINKMKNLEVLLLNGAEYTFEVPKTYPYKFYDPEHCHNDQAEPERFNKPQKQIKSLLKMRLPPKLRVLKMEYAGLWYFLTEFNVNSNNSLEELVLSNNYFPSISGPFRGLDKLKKLVMNNCQITDMNREFFEYFQSLEHLDLYGNLIGLGDSLFHQPFKNLTKLRYLNISFNDILNLSNDTFIGLSELRELNLSNNTIFEFNADISNMSKLESLYLKATSIHTLSPVTRRYINKLYNITVQLSGSPLYCDCTNMDFLNWMIRDDNDVIPKDSEFICVLKNRASLNLNWGKFISEVRVIQRECASNYPLFLAVLGATVLLIVLVTGSILYRFRWRLRYIYYGVHLWITSRNVEKEENSFKFDVFISYSNEDLNFVLGTVCSELESRGLKTCIHSRHFNAGENIITNIIKAVKFSKKTLIVLTNKFVSSKWCRAEFQMAKEEAVVSGRNLLVFLIADRIPMNKIGLELLTHIQQNTYIPFPGEVDNSEPCPNEAQARPTSSKEMKMWDKLVRDLTH